MTAPPPSSSSDSRLLSIGCIVGAVPGTAVLLYLLITRSPGAELGFAFGLAFWATVTIFVGAAVGGWLGLFLASKRP